MKKTSSLLLTGIVGLMVACDAPNEVKESVETQPLDSIPVAMNSTSLVDTQTVSTPEPPKKLHKPSAPSLKKYLRQRDRKKVARFTIDSDRDTTVKLPQGTVVKFEQSAFVSKSTGNPVEGPVEIHVKEYYGLGDFLTAGLTTQFDGGLLESGGTVYVSATAGGEACELAQGRTLKLAYNNQEQSRNMNIYYGKTNESGQVVWTAGEGMAPVYPDTRNPGRRISSINASSLMFIDLEDRGIYARKPQCVDCPGLFTVDNFQKVIQHMRLSSRQGFKVRLVIDQFGEVDSLYMLSGLNPQADAALLSIYKSVKFWLPPEAMVNYSTASYDSRIELGSYEEPYVHFCDVQQASYTVEEFQRIMEERRAWVAERYAEREAKAKQMKELQARIDRGDETMVETSSADLVKYYYQSSRLGWINLDRPISAMPAILAVKTEEIQNSQVYVVLKKRKGISGGWYDPASNEYRFKNLPHGDEAIVMAMRETDNGVELASREIVIGNKTIQNLEFVPVTYAELGKQLAILD